MAGLSKFVILTLTASSVLLGGLLVAKGRDPETAGAVCPNCTNIKTDAELTSAVHLAKSGAVLTLAPGARFGLHIFRKVAASNITIKSADPARPAVFAGLSFHDISGVKLRNLRFEGPVVHMHYKLLFERCRNVDLEGLAFIGDATTYDEPTHSAAMIRWTKSARIHGNQFSRFNAGLTMLTVSDVEVSDNSFADMRVDGIRGGGISNAIIRRNQAVNFHPYPDDHPDGIQLWTTNETVAARNILIEDNLVVRGTGGAIQGIFIRDEVGTLPYQNLTLRGNLVVGALYNGITAMGIDKAVIDGNIVLPNPDQASWIRIEMARNTIMTNNRAGAYITKGQIKQSKSSLINATSKPAKTIRQWAQLHNMEPLSDGESN